MPERADKAEVAVVEEEVKDRRDSAVVPEGRKANATTDREIIEERQIVIRRADRLAMLLALVFVARARRRSGGTKSQHD